MADFTLNAPGTTDNDYQPANIILPVHDSTHGLRSDATGIRGKADGGKFGHNADYGSTITTTITYSNQSNGDLDVFGAIVRTGANAGGIIGVWLSGGGYRPCTEAPDGTVSFIAGFQSYPGPGGVRADNDVFAITVSISGGTATISATQNGASMPMGLDTTTTYAGEASLAAGGNVSPTDYISKFEGTGVVVSDAILTPARAQLTLNGRNPTTSAFNNVRIRDVLVNESGQAVANAANITLLVWYGGIARGAPDVSLNGQTTDANGSASWSIPTGALSFNSPIFYVAQDSVSFSNYTCGRMIPSYES